MIIRQTTAAPRRGSYQADPPSPAATRPACDPPRPCGTEGVSAMSTLRATRPVGICAVLLGVAVLPCAVRGADRPVRDSVDAEIKAGWARGKATPAKPASDSEFLRRVSLDLIGVVPSYEE